MTKEQLQQGKETEAKITIVEEYLQKFNPERFAVWLVSSDRYGNCPNTLKLYAHSTEESIAIGNDKFTRYYREFLQKCTSDLQKRKEELEKSLESII